MKHIKKLIVLALASVFAHAADDCAQTDHLFYDSACCSEEGKNCLDDPKASKAAVNNLLT